MKILMVSSYLPYPLFSGGHIRLYNIIKNLSKNHQITLVCEKRAYQNGQDIAEVGKFCKKIITVDRKKQWTLKNIFKTGFSKYPFLVTGHTHSQMKREIKKILEKEKFDLIHVETFYIMQNLPARIATQSVAGGPKVTVPVVLTEHNIESLVYERFKQSTPFFIKPLLNIDILKLKKIEEKAWTKANAVIAVSKNDRNIIKDFNKNVYVVPNGVDLEEFRVQPFGVAQDKSSEFRVQNNRERTILFIGDFRWVENRDAARMILKEIWPAIKLKIGSSELRIKLWIVGRKIPDSIKKLGTDGVVFDENALSDTSKIYEKADLLLAPIRIGGGTSFKILEAMASGVAVVTTNLGAVGIGAKNREEVIIAENKEEFSDSIIELLKDKNLYEKITKNARSLVEEKYNWENIAKELVKVYRSVV
ncbi:MAG: glycosyltransferase family 4 protein [Patescibacteria group bacterium]